MTTLIDTDDVTLWAEEFCRIFQGYRIVPDASVKPKADQLTMVDEDTMISWFANAMETSKRMYRDRLSVTAHLNDDGAIVIDGDLPQDVLVSSELLRTMVDAHNANIEIKPPSAGEKLTPERAVRLLRAKAHELENWVLAETRLDGEMRPNVTMAADIALVADLLADHMERMERLWSNLRLDDA